MMLFVAELCKGSTADSDSVCLGSNPSSAAKKSDKFRLVGFFYPSRQAWYIITRQRVYHQHGIAVLYLITPLGVYFCRLDDIQNFVLMICNSCGIDDIQCCALILTKLYSIIITKEVVICFQIICLCILNSWQPI